jgi:DNA-binding FadR family transcriptional regulator
VREALRLLTAQSLIRTAKGAGGGTYVTMPTVDHVSEFLNSALNLLAAAEHVTLDELLEAREALEVPAARLAAQRRTEATVEDLRAAIPPDPPKLSPTEEFVYNADFHNCVIAASGNAFLMMAAQPLFSILQTQLARSSLGSRFHRGIHQQHHAILAAIEGGETRRAEREMRQHLEFLRPHYERTWRYAVRAAEHA